ncbi:MAG: NAD-glutamate dehydrogenase, partial [Pseudomonadales bacterium]
SAFPKVLLKKYKKQIGQHRLHKEIVATQIANHVVNRMGITYLERMLLSTGSNVSCIARAYVTARDIFSLDQHWIAIEQLDHQMPASMQLRLMRELKRLIRRASRWFLRNRRSELDPQVEIERFVPGVTAINESLEQLLNGHLLESFHQRKAKILEHPVPTELAHYVAGAPILYAGVGIVEAAYATETDVVDVANMYFNLGEALHLHWFAQQISELKVESHWQALAREAYRDDLEWQQSAITISALRNMKLDAEHNVEQSIDNWLEVNAEDVHHWHAMINEMRAMHTNDFAVYTVANRALLDLARRSSYTAEG